MTKYIFFILTLSILSCSSRIKENSINVSQSAKADKLKVLPDSITITKDHLPRPSAPVNIEGQKEKAIYEALHFWDMVNFSDLSLIREEKQRLDNSIVNFLGLIKTLDNETSQKAVLYPLEKSNGDVLRYILSSYFKYLYRYNSPFVNHIVYESVLNWSTKTTKLRIAEQQQAKRLLSVITRNKVGAKAENFEYQSIDNVTRMLNRSFAKYVLLIFYSPSCGVCKNEAKEISQNTKLEELVKKNELEILFIYPGNNEKLWQESLQWLPVFAKSGIASEQIVSDGIYDIQAWPTIYLLNSKSEVLLSDCSLKDAINTIMNKK